MITNKDLKMCNEQLFSYSAAYQVPFYGRGKSIAEMQELTEKLEAGQTIVISAPLGTGKTFLVNYLINNQKIQVPPGISFLTVRGIVEQPQVLEQFPGDILVVDEADIKTPVRKLQAGLDALGKYLEDSGRKAILLGDYTLKNKDICRSIRHPVPLHNFEHIDRQFLEGALRQRFLHFLKLDDSFQIMDVMEDKLIGYLAPEWMKQANSFRGMFSLLQQVVADNECVRFNGEKAFLTVKMFHEFLCRDHELGLEEDQEQFLHLLKAYIAEMYPEGNGITSGILMDELYQVARNGGMDISEQAFTEDIIYPLAAADLLVSAGVPEYDEARRFFVRRPAPYVPSLQLLLSVTK